MKLTEAPLRAVLRFEWCGASRYTGYEPKSVRLFLACGHELFRKQSQGVPKNARCRDCGHAALAQSVEKS